MKNKYGDLSKLNNFFLFLKENITPQQSELRIFKGKNPKSADFFGQNNQP